MSMDRRAFLKYSAFASALAALGGPQLGCEPRNGIPYRILGKTGEAVSLLGLGGYHIGLNTLSDSESIQIMRTAIDEGVNFMDNAHGYHAGRSEELMGKALRDGYRDKVFLMTKHYTFDRDATSAAQQLEDSLRRLETDVIDLWQVHQIHDAGHPAAVYENEIPEMMLQAQAEGKVRYIGFTGHSHPDWHMEMLDGWSDWDTVQLPLNTFDHHWNSFEHTVLPQALDLNMGIIGMKPLGGEAQFLKDSGPFTVEECLHYAMNLPTATVICGMDRLDYLEQALEATRNFRPLSESEVAELLARSSEPAADGEFEYYKERLGRRTFLR